MERYAFKMFLKPDMAAEYKRRHDEIWPELVDLLHDTGISEYAIYLDPDTHILFGVLLRHQGHSMASLPDHPVMQRWRIYMSDLLRIDEKGTPVAIPLESVFYMK